MHTLKTSSAEPRRGTTVSEAGKKLLKLRLTDTLGEGGHSITVREALRSGLSGLYEDEVIDYILKFAIKYTRAQEVKP